MLGSEPVADGRAGGITEEADRRLAGVVRHGKNVAHVEVDAVLRHVSRPAAPPAAAMVDENQPASEESSCVSGQSPHPEVACAAGVQDDRGSVALDLVVDRDSRAGDRSHRPGRIVAQR